ncbi:MAG TPA: hypothetical protein V6C57_23660 [Coleofasciculaceae cyanobacterium]
MGKTVGNADIDLDDILKSINAELEYVGLRIKGDRFYVRGSKFPPKPGAELVFRHEIPTGCKVSESGLRMARAIALEIDSKLIRNVFDWTPYLKAKYRPAELVGEWVERFIADHWSRVPRDRNTERCFEKGYIAFYQVLPQDVPLSFELLKRNLTKRSKPGTRNRLAYSTAYGKLADFAQIGGGDQLRNLGKGYTASSIDPRDLPSDEQIIEMYSKIKNPGWKWIFGVLAVYGLRNHEAFFLDISGINKGLQTVQVLEGKTGPRVVYPCLGEGWDIDLSCRFLPSIKWQEYSHNKIGTKVSAWFSFNKKIVNDFTAYSLRHSYARRMFEQGQSSRLAAKSMGHSVQIHEKTYSAWWGQDAYDRVFKEARDRYQRNLNQP